MKFIVELSNEHDYAEVDMADVIVEALDDYGIHATATPIKE